MSGNLPVVRVATSAAYADDFVDEKPVEKPDTELPAAVFNAMKSDLAYCTRVVPRLIIVVSAAGAVEHVLGPEGVVVGDVTVTGSGAPFSVDWSGVGIVESFVEVVNRGDGRANPDNYSQNSIDVYTFDAAGAAAARAFALKAY